MLKWIIMGLLIITLVSCDKKEDNSKLLSNYIQIEKVINIGAEYKGGSPNFLIAINNDEIFMKPELTAKGLGMNVYNQKHNKMKHITFNLSKAISDTLQYCSEPLDFDVSEKNIYAMFSHYLLVIDRNDSNNTYLNDLKEGFQKLKVSGNTIILCRAYKFSAPPTSNMVPVPICIAQYDLLSKKITKSVELSSNALEFSHFTPSNWFDISNSGDVVFTQAISPEQAIDNNNLELKQKLTYKPKNWQQVDMTELNYIRKLKKEPDPQEIIARLIKTDDGVGCRMISVNFVNDSTLLAFYTSPSVKEKVDFVRYCNIWKRKNDKWVLFDKALKDAYPDISATLTKENFPFNGSMQKLRFYNNKAYYIYVSPDEEKLLQFGKKFSVVKKEMNRHFAEDKLFHQLYIFNCRF
jgi:hypothetical protein